MESLFRLAERLTPLALRVSLGVVLGWIGALKFIDPKPVVDLLGASFSFLAFPGFVYLLGTVEVTVAALLFLGVAQRWVGLVLVGLFAGTLTILVIAPAVSFGNAGFPNLSLAGEFLLKDLVLFASGIALAGLAPRGRAAVAR
jgi:reactive chlorine resistance protein C